jgi:hypothetical protein
MQAWTIPPFDRFPVAKKKRLRVLLNTAGEPSVESLLRDCLASPTRSDQLRVLSRLAHSATSPQQIADLLHSLNVSGVHGPRLALEFLHRLESEIPTASIPLATQLLADRRALFSLRLSVAGKLLDQLPDMKDAIEPITCAITTGLSRSRVLQRLLELQSRVTLSKSLDAKVTELEQRVKLRCPLCRQVFRRPELVLHLWTAHRLTFEAGVTLDPQMSVQRVIDDASTSGDARKFDVGFHQAMLLRTDWCELDVLRRMTIRQASSAMSIPATLTRQAADHKSGLCAKCLAELPDAMPELPPPLSVGSGRLSGDGYAVEVRESQLGRVVRVITPRGTEDDAPASTNRYSPRAAAVWIACPSLFVGLLVSFRVPATIGAMLLLVVITLLVSAFTYILVLLLRPKLVNRSQLALDVAWQRLVSTLDTTPASARWLVRLCRASWNRGDAEERRTPLFHLVNQAEALVDVSSVHEQALAACRLLQIVDQTDKNGERTRALIQFFKDFLEGQRTPIFLEAVAEMLQDQAFFLDAERRRHPPLAIAAAFEAGWSTDDVRLLFHTLPFTRQWLGQPSEAYLRQLFSLWNWRHKQPWATFGTGITILELAGRQPSVARRVFMHYPSATMKIVLDEPTEKELGDVVLTEEGVVIRGIVFPDADQVRVERSSRGAGWTLLGGVEPLQLDRGLPRTSVSLLRGWIRWFAEHDGHWTTTTELRPTQRTRRLLKSLLCECPECGTLSIVRRGRLSHTVPKLSAEPVS